MTGSTVNGLIELLLSRDGFVMSGKAGALGTLGGVPLHVFDEPGFLILTMAVASSEAAEVAAEFLRWESVLVEGGWLYRENVDARDAHLRARLHLRHVLDDRPEEILDAIDKTMEAVGELPDTRPACPEGTVLALVDDVPTYLSPSAERELMIVKEPAPRQYGQRPINTSIALDYRLVAALGGAWALVALAFGLPMWIVAIGLVIAVVAVVLRRAAGKTRNSVRPKLPPTVDYGVRRSEPPELPTQRDR